MVPHLHNNGLCYKLPKIYYWQTSSCDHLSSVTSFTKYEKFPSQIPIFGTPCKQPPLVSEAQEVFKKFFHFEIILTEADPGEGWWGLQPPLWAKFFSYFFLFFLKNNSPSTPLALKVTTIVYNPPFKKFLDLPLLNPFCWCSNRLQV